MTKLNCPNCGAPIDIHRKDCEYCGTPYDLRDQEVLYADNQPFYIYQNPIEWSDNASQAKNLEAWRQELTRQCVNAYPKVNYGSLIEEPKDEATGYIWETIKIVLVTVAFFLPVLIPIILGALDIF